MKICHITTVHKQNDVRIFVKQCVSLAKHWDVSFLVVNGDPEEREGVLVKGVAVDFQSRLSRFLKAPKSVYQKALAENADIYHFHDPEFIPYGLKLLKQGKKVIYDVHEDVPRQILGKYWIPFPFRKAISVLFEKYENYAAKRFTQVIAATPFIKDRFLSIGVQSIDINNYPIIDKIHPVGELNFDAVCYVGGITMARGIKENILAAHKAGVKFELAGGYSPESLRQNFIQLKEWNNVTEHGFLDNNGVNKVFSSSFAGMVTLHPLVNYLDSLPIKMFEYMAAGLPVIASNFPLWKSIVEDNKCGVCVNPLDVEDISNAIEMLKNDKNKAQEMGQNGLALVKDKYNWKIEERKLINLYKSLED